MTDDADKTGQNIRQGASWVLGGNAFTEIAGFVVGILLARLLMPAEFGLVATVGVLTGLVGYLAGAGMGQSLVRAKQVTQRHYDVVFTLQLGSGALIYLLFVLVAKPFADFFEQPLLQPLLLVSGLSFFLRPFANLPSARLQREMQFGAQVSIGAIAMVLGSGVSIALAVMGWSVWSLVLGGLLTALIRAVLLNWHVGRLSRLAWDATIAREMAGYGAKVAGNTLIEQLRMQSLVSLIGKTSGPGDVGLFSRASSLALMPMKIVGSAPYQAVFRSLAANRDNLDRSRYIYYRTLTLVSVYTLPVFLLVGWLAEPGVHFVYGAAWSGAVEPLRILVFATATLCLANPSGAVVEAQNRVGTEIRINLVAWAVLLAGALYAQQWGLTGIAWTILVVKIFFALAVAVVAQQELRGSLRALWRAFIPAVLLVSFTILVMLAAELLLPDALASNQPGLYCCVMGSVAAITYLTGFLLSPPRSLYSEANRWRAKLGLKPLISII